MSGWWCGDDDRVDVGQRVVDVGVGGNAVIDLLTPVVDAREALVHADDRRHAGRGRKHAYVPRPPVTDTDDAYPESLRLDRHTVPLRPVRTVLAFRIPFGRVRAARTRSAHPRISAGNFIAWPRHCWGGPGPGPDKLRWDRVSATASSVEWTPSLAMRFCR